MSGGTNFAFAGDNQRMFHLVIKMSIGDVFHRPPRTAETEATLFQHLKSLKTADAVFKVMHTNFPLIFIVSDRLQREILRVEGVINMSLFAGKQKIAERWLGYRQNRLGHRKRKHPVVQRLQSCQCLFRVVRILRLTELTLDFSKPSHKLPHLIASEFVTHDNPPLVLAHARQCDIAPTNTCRFKERCINNIF